MVTSSFQGVNASVGQLQDGGADGYSNLVRRSADGAVLTWGYQFGTPTGLRSSTIYAVTDATTYRTGQITLSDSIGGGTVTAQSFAPVPEPGTMLAIGAGLAAIAARRRRR